MGVAVLMGDLQGGRRDEGKGSGSRSVADKAVERSRRSVEMRKVTSTADRDRRKSAPIPRRYVPHPHNPLQRVM